MEWTTKLPTTPGWYWTWYGKGADEPDETDEEPIDMATLVRVSWRFADEKEMFFLTEDDGWWPVSNRKYWMGPLPEPEPPIV